MRETFKSRFLPLLLTLVLFLILQFANRAEARDVHVCLTEGAARITITSDASITLIDSAKKTHKLGKSAVLTRAGAFAALGKNRFPLPAEVSSRGLLGFNGRSYRGRFLITKAFALLNVLDVEDYVRGVLPAEASPSWPKEYLKAQAIISRTYGLRQGQGRSSRGYDVTDGAAYQVYRGAGGETPATNQAVRETEDQVLLYGNALAFTPFHSDSGGHTAANVHVWTQNIPYLTGVREPIAYQSPNSSWSASIPTAQVQAALSRIGGGSVGQPREVRVAAVDTGGRALDLTFVGSGGSFSAKSSVFRTAIGPNLLKSTMLTEGNLLTTLTKGENSSWTPESSLPQASALPPLLDSLMSGSEEAHLIQMTSEGAFTSAELMDMLMNPEKRKDYLYSKLGRAPKKPEPSAKPQPEIPTPLSKAGVVVSQKNGYFTFYGKGWGHGVGLSQWGAQALAKEGWTAQRILEHYYPGTTVKRFK
ncbi:MAG: SpoIID/LytB domain-containing protein [Synergistaceae bacterium]|nr:SpoIID/LytB domain-containing protein [Synergistaceae bacterium]